MRSLFSKFREGFRRTNDGVFRAFGRIGNLLPGRKIDAASLDELEEALYMADFGVETTEEILEEIRAAYRSNRELRGQEAAAIGASVLARVLEGAEGRLVDWQHKPEVIVLVGVNGSGKTTTTAKLGRLFSAEGTKPLVGACDTFRAAANEQLRTWCERLDLDLVSSHHGADAASVAFDAYEAARRRGAEVLLLDTAGRLHTKSNLMKELEKISRVLKKHDDSAPHHRWLVVDGSLGSNSIAQAKVFHAEFGLTGLIVTKLDGTSRGGALVGIFREMKLPIYFVGLGEKAEDLQPFSIENYSKAVFGMES